MLVTTAIMNGDQNSQLDRTAQDWRHLNKRVLVRIPQNESRGHSIN